MVTSDILAIGKTKRLHEVLICQKCNKTTSSWAACAIHKEGNQNILLFFGLYCFSCYMYKRELYLKYYSKKAEIVICELVKSGISRETLLARYDADLVHIYNPVNYQLREVLF